jgi:hypothetical protein
MEVLARDTLLWETIADFPDPAAEMGAGSVRGDIRSSVRLFLIRGSKELRRVSVSLITLVRIEEGFIEFSAAEGEDALG